MHIFEKGCITLRHSHFLEQKDWFWNWARPRYNKTIALLAQKGLERTINGTDSILVLPELRGVPEIYEPDIWKHMMAEVRPGDIVTDVGAFIGLYTVALASRVGPSGKVVAFEPNPKNFSLLKAQVELNKVSERVELIQTAVGTKDGTVFFEANRSSESKVSPISENGSQSVKCVSLDTIFSTEHIDILKIDVEGYEEEVLKGAVRLLRDSRRAPRIIYIEVHPYNWKEIGTTAESLLSFLRECRYQIFDQNSRPVKKIDVWGEIIARKINN